MHQGTYITVCFYRGVISPKQTTQQEKSQLEALKLDHLSCFLNIAIQLHDLSSFLSQAK